jgi:hypothetical protein
MDRFSGMSANSAYPRRTGRFARGKDSNLNDRDIHLHVTVPGKRSGISEVKRVGVSAHALDLPVEGEDDARLLSDCGVDGIETRTNFFERKRHLAGGK